MKLAEMRQLNIDELNEKVAGFRKELFEMRLQNSVRQLDNTAQLRTLRHRIAQLETVLREKRSEETANV